MDGVQWVNDEWNSLMSFPSRHRSNHLLESRLDERLDGATEWTAGASTHTDLSNAKSTSVQAQQLNFMKIVQWQRSHYRILFGALMPFLYWCIHKSLSTAGECLASTRRIQRWECQGTSDGVLTYPVFLSQVFLSSLAICSVQTQSHR